MEPNNRVVQQAVVVSQNNMVSTRGTTRLALFNEDGTPLLNQGKLSYRVQDYSSPQEAINAARDNGGGVVSFASNTTYNLTTRLDLYSNVRLEGGPGSIVDFSSVPLVGSSRIGIRALGTLDSPLLLSVDGNVGTYSITAVSVVGLNVGDWIRLSSNSDYPYSSNLKRGEIKQIFSIVGNVVTFEQALCDNYLVVDTSVISKINFVENVQIEGITFRGSNTPGDGNRSLTLEFVNDFSIRNCKFINSDTYAIYVRSSIRGEIYSNIFRGVYYDGVNGSIFYAILLSSAAQWVRIFGNHGERIRHLVTISSATNDPGAPRYNIISNNIAQNLEAGGGGRSWAFESHGVGEDNLFDSNVADSCYGGFVTRGPGVSFTNNKVSNWYAYGLHIHSDIKDARDIVISGNTVKNRTIEGGGFSTPSAIRAELTNATSVINVVIQGNTITQDVINQPAIKVDGPSVVASSLVVKDNIIYHPASTVDSISLTVQGGIRHGNVINGIPEGDGTLDEMSSSLVSTMPRQYVGSSLGTVASGTIVAGRAKVVRAGVFSKIRFCTGTTAPSGITDFRGGVWDSSATTVLATTNNESASVIAASTVYELSFPSPITLAANQEIYIGIAVVGTTPGTYRGIASFSGINNLDPAISKARTSWAGGTLLSLTSSYSGIPWAELVP